MKEKYYEQYFKKINQPIAFILGNHLTTGLGVVRSLGYKNIPVVWLDYTPNQIGFHSKYCLGLHCPHPQKEKKYVDVLIRIGKNLNKKGVLFPISDNDVYVVSKHRGILEKYFVFPFSKLNIIDRMLNKKKFYQILQKHKMPHAKTFFPKNTSDVQKISKSITFPCIVKPAYSGFFRADFKTKMFTARSKKDLIYKYTIATEKNHELLIQEIIPGDVNHMYGFNAYYDSMHQCHGGFAYKRIREWPPKFGNGCFIKHTETIDLEEQVTLLMKKIKFSGIVDVEVKKDPRDNTFKFIEINPRLWMQNSLLTRFGINLPYISYQDALGERFDKIQVQNKDVTWVCMMLDVSSSYIRFKNGEMTLREWLFSLKGKKEYAIFSCNDPLPGLILGVMLLFTFLPNLYKSLKFQKEIIFMSKIE